MSRLPIRVRLTLGFTVAMAIVLAGIGAFVYLRVGSTLLGSIDQTLRLQATEASTRTHETRGLVDKDTAAGTTLAQVLTTSGTVVRSSPAMPPLLTASDAVRVATGTTLHRSVELKQPKGEWRLLAVPGSGGSAVVVARSLAARDESLDRLLDGLVLGGIIGLVLTSLLGYGLAAAALRPVEAMRRRAAAITTSAMAVLPEPRSRDEISRLATTLNDMLSRLHAAFEHERRFLADASHELRTPLALLRTELDLALRRPRSQPELEDALRSAADETERLSRLAEELLLIARADQGGLPMRREPVPVADLFARFGRRGSIHVVETDALVDADPLRVEQALDNLVENALEYGAGTIAIYAVERDDVVELHVSDEGPGFPDGFLERAFDRFSRSDDARSSGGAGLGLSIVLLIARAHGCDAGARNRAEGGADVWISVPRQLDRERRSAADARAH